MISSDNMIGLRVAVKNVKILQTFEVGDKPLSDSTTGLITKEKRSWFVSWRRGVWGGFDPSSLDKTMRKVNNHLKTYEWEFASVDDQRYMKDHPDFAQLFRENYPKVLAGIENIKMTYMNEAQYEEGRWKALNHVKSKNKMVEKIQAVIDKYQGVDEKKKVKEGVSSSRDRVSKPIVTHDDFIKDLNCSFRKGLKKTVVSNQTVTENSLGRSFNLSLLSHSQIRFERVEENLDSEWSSEEEVVFDVVVPERRVIKPQPKLARKPRKKVVFDHSRMNNRIALLLRKRRKKLKGEIE